MAIRKLLLEAFSKIPTRFIDAETDWITMGDNYEEGKIFIANPKYAPMVYKGYDRRWKKIKIKK
jgi:hypothetical protein